MVGMFAYSGLRTNPANKLNALLAAGALAFGLDGLIGQAGQAAAELV